jgi:hypothetical protein
LAPSSLTFTTRGELGLTEQELRGALCAGPAKMVAMREKRKALTRKIVLKGIGRNCCVGFVTRT